MEVLAQTITRWLRFKPRTSVDMTVDPFIRDPRVGLPSLRNGRARPFTGSLPVA